MNEFSPSELVYLYVDGEINASQQAALFVALAHDSDLQAEFNDAIALKLSTSTEVRSTMPAPELKSALFQKAGFSAAAGAGAATAGMTGATASATSAATASATSAVATSAKVFIAAGWLSGSKAVVLSVLSVVSGVLMFATGAMLWYNSLDAGAHSLAGEKASYGEAIHVPHNRVTSDSASAVVANSVGAEERTRGSNEAQHAPAQTSLFPNAVYTLRTAERRTAHAKPAATENDRYTEMQVNQPVPTDAEASRIVAVQPEYVRRAMLAEPPLSLSAEPPELLSVNSLLGEASFTSESSFKWGVTARGIIGLRLFPDREMGVASDILDNTAIGAVWVINDEHAAGVEIGREILPMYISDSDGRLREVQSLAWVGVNYRYSPHVIQLADGLQPFITGFAGGTEAGPLLKSSVGLLWNPNSHIQFSLGAEGTFLMYRYQQQWYGTQKLGVSYGVTVAFP